MTPNDFLSQLNNLPPDTPITAHHLISILSILATDTIEKAEDKPPSSLNREDLITEEQLASWINKNVQTLRNWRVDGKGPKFIKDSRTVNYRVGTVIDWLKSREVQSTTQADALKFGSIEYGSVFPTIYCNDIAYPFFESLDEELDITGYQTIHTEQDSLAEWLLSVFEVNIEAHSIISELHNRIKAGEDINALQKLLINGEEVESSLSHLIANYHTNDFQSYSYLVQGFLDVDLDFRQVNSNNETALDFANKNDNNALIKMINSYELYKKLNHELPNKQ